MARQRALEAVTIAERHGWGGAWVVAPALLSAGWVDLWQARFEDAEGWLARAERAIDINLDCVTGLLLHVVQGMRLEAAGRYEQALAAFREAERLEAALVAGPAFRVLVGGLVARMQTRLGDTAAARQKLDELSGEERDWGASRITLALLHLAEGDAAAAVDAVGPVLHGSAPVFHVCSLIQAFLLDALAREDLGDTAHVESDIERALDLAEPDGLIWPFVTTGTQKLLERHRPKSRGHAVLLARIHEVLFGSAPQPSGSDGLAAKLTDGELRVLRYLSSSLSAPEIGAELYLSVNTVKTHMRHIYAKLGVRRRTDAIERAHALGLVPAPTLRHRS